MNDIRFAFRQLWKSPGFTLVAVITLALGIGANSAIFSVVDAVLLRPLPFPKPNELIAVWSKVGRHGGEKETDSFPNYADLRDQSQTLQSLTAFTRAGAVLSRAEESKELLGLAVTSDIFRVLGISPMLGRPFTREEDSVDARVVVFTHEAWRTLFNSDPNIIGRQVNLSFRSYTCPPASNFRSKANARNISCHCIRLLRMKSKGAALIFFVWSAG